MLCMLVVQSIYSLRSTHPISLLSYSSSHVDRMFNNFCVILAVRHSALPFVFRAVVVLVALQRAVATVPKGRFHPKSDFGNKLRLIDLGPCVNNVYICMCSSPKALYVRSIVHACDGHFLFCSNVSALSRSCSSFVSSFGLILT